MQAERRQFSQYTGIILRPVAATSGEVRTILDERFGSAGTVAGWREYTVVSPAPLMNELTIGPFEYDLYALLGRTLVVLLTIGEAVVAHVRDEVLTPLRDRLRELSIDIDGVVNDISAGIPYMSARSGQQRPIRYALSSLHARTPGLGADIKSLSLYGDNIANGSIFRQHRDLLNATACGVRRSTTREIVKLNATATIALQVNARWLDQRLADLTEVIAYVHARGHVLDAAVDDTFVSPPE